MLLKLMTRYLASPLAILFSFIIAFGPALTAADRITIPASPCGPAAALKNAGHSYMLVPALQHKDGSKLLPADVRTVTDKEFFLSPSAKPNKAAYLAFIGEETGKFGKAKPCTGAAVTGSKGRTAITPAGKGKIEKASANCPPTPAPPEVKPVTVQVGFPYFTEGLFVGQTFAVSPAVVYTDGTKHSDISFESSKPEVLSAVWKNGMLQLKALKAGDAVITIKSEKDSRVGTVRTFTVEPKPVKSNFPWWTLLFLLAGPLGFLLARRENLMYSYRNWRQRRNEREELSDIPSEGGFLGPINGPEEPESMPTWLEERPEEPVPVTIVEEPATAEPKPIDLVPAKVRAQVERIRTRTNGGNGAEKPVIAGEPTAITHEEKVVETVSEKVEFAPQGEVHATEKEPDGNEPLPSYTAPK